MQVSDSPAAAAQPNISEVWTSPYGLGLFNIKVDLQNYNL